MCVVYAYGLVMALMSSDVNQTLKDRLQVINQLLKPVKCIKKSIKLKQKPSLVQMGLSSEKTESRFNLTTNCTVHTIWKIAKVNSKMIFGIRYLKKN